MKIAVPDYQGGRIWIEVDENYRRVEEKFDTAEEYMEAAMSAFSVSMNILALSPEEFEEMNQRFIDSATDDEVRDFLAYEKALATPVVDSEAVKEAYRIIGHSKYA